MGLYFIEFNISDDVMISFTEMTYFVVIRKYRSLKNPNKYVVFELRVNDMNDILYLCRGFG